MKANQHKAHAAEREHQQVDRQQQGKAITSLSLVWQKQQQLRPQPLAELEIERCAELGYN